MARRTPSKRVKHGRHFTRNLKVDVQRFQHGKNAFEACAWFQGAGSGHGPPISPYSKSMRCARGKNPREAVARALGLVAKAVKARRGAFAGRK